MNRRQFLSTIGAVGLAPFALDMQNQRDDDDDGDYRVSCSTPADFNTTIQDDEDFSVGNPESKPWGDRNVKVIRDITYHETPQGPQKLDLYLPWTHEWNPGMVYIHGGAWMFGSKGGVTAEYAVRMATLGYVGVDINYRLSSSVDFPAPVNDVNAAIKWLRKHANEYNIDTKQIGTLGNSAGGHLAALAGVTDDTPKFEPSGYPSDLSSDVQAVVSHYGFYDFTAQRDPVFPAALLGSEPDEIPEVAKAASPITHVSSDDPPHFLTHGIDDGTIPVTQAIRYRNTLKETGIPVWAWFLAEGEHGATNEPPFRATAMKKTQEFLQHYMPIRNLRDEKGDGGRMYDSCGEVLDEMS